MNNYAYIVYETTIKVTNGLDAGIDYPQSHSMTFLHQYNLGTAVNYLIGFGWVS